MKKFFYNFWKEIPLKKDSRADFPIGFDTRAKEERGKPVKRQSQLNVFSILNRVAESLTNKPDNFYGAPDFTPYPPIRRSRSAKFVLAALALTTTAVASYETVKKLDAGVLADEAKLASMSSRDSIDHRLLGLSSMPAEKYAVLVTKSAEGKCSLANAVRLVVDNGAVYPASDSLVDPFFPNNSVQTIKECTPFEPATLFPPSSLPSPASG